MISSRKPMPGRKRFAAKRIPLESFEPVRNNRDVNVFTSVFAPQNSPSKLLRRNDNRATSTREPPSEKKRSANDEATPRDEGAKTSKRKISSLKTLWDRVVTSVKSAIDELFFDESETENRTKAQRIFSPPKVF